MAKAAAKPTKAKTSPKAEVQDEIEDEDIFNTESPTDVAERNRKAREGAGSYTPYFSLKDGETAVIRFLKDKPLTFYQHRVWDLAGKEGKGGHRNLTCARNGCTLCAAGDKPRYVGAYPVIHIDNVENGKDAPRLKIFLKGVNVLEVLERRNKKRPLSSENLEVERIGDGFDTKYTFEGTGEKEMPDYAEPEEPLVLKDMFAVADEETMDRFAELQSAKADKKKGTKKTSESSDEEDEERKPPKKNGSSSPRGKGKTETNDDDDIPF